MMARRMFDGTLRLDVSPEEARLLLAALERESCHHAAHAVRADCSARDRRDLAAQVKRGAHANRRVAGELEAEGRRHADRRDLALDMQRVLLPHVSAEVARARSQMLSPSQTEPPRKYGYTQKRLDELRAEGDTHFLDWTPAKKER